MKKITLLLLAFVCLNLAWSQNGNWVVKKDIARAFRAEFPVQVQMQSQPVNTAVGDVTMDMYMVDQSSNANADNLIYMVAFTEYPNNSDYDDEGLQNSMLDGSVSGAVSNVKGTLLSSDNIRFNGFNARDAFITIQEGLYTIHLRNILVGNKLYLIQTITETGKAGNSSEKKFFNSFELIKTN